MKAVIVVPGRWHAFDLAVELGRLGALHRIVTSYPRRIVMRWGIPGEKIVSLPVQLLLTRAAWRLGGEGLALRVQYVVNNIFAHQATRHLQGADLVHAWSGSAEPCLQVCRERRVPTMVERSSAHMVVQQRIMKEEHQRLGIRWAATPQATVNRELREYNEARRIAVPSEFVEQSFIREGVPREKLFKNMFGVDTTLFSPGLKTGDRFTVLYTGSLSVRKGIGYLSDGFKRANLAEAKLILVGGLVAESLKLMGDDTRFTIVGHKPQQELPAFYHNADVFVIPSLEEGQALVQLQALATGLPLICTEHSGGEDLLQLTNRKPVTHEHGIREYPAGFVVPIRNGGAIAACLTWLYHDREKLARMRAEALQLRRNNLSWNGYASRALDEYTRLVRG